VTRLLAQASVIGALTGAILILHIAPSSADGWETHHRTRHVVRVAYADTTPDYGVCRIGWWQSLRYGHVRPHWVEFCPAGVAAPYYYYHDRW
jgi:hypothetical protein